MSFAVLVRPLAVIIGDAFCVAKGTCVRGFILPSAGSDYTNGQRRSDSSALQARPSRCNRLQRQFVCYPKERHRRSAEN